MVEAMGIWRWVVIVAVAVLAACAPVNGNLVTAGDGCAADPRTRDIDWNKVAAIPVRIRQGEVMPMVISLRQGQPYVLRISNGDDAGRRFDAPAFFRSVAVAGVSVGGRDVPETCIAGLAIAGRSAVEVRLLTLRDGRYEFEGSGFSVSGLASGGGVIFVEYVSGG